MFYFYLFIYFPHEQCWVAHDWSNIKKHVPMNQFTKLTYFTALQGCFAALVKSTRRNICIAYLSNLC